MKHSVGKNLTHNVSNTLITVPAGYKAEITTLFVSNRQGNNKHVTVYWQHAHDITHKIYIVNEYTIAANNYLTFTDKQLVMQEGDSIVIVPQLDSDMSAIVSFDLKKEQAVLAFDGE